MATIQELEDLAFSNSKKVPVGTKFLITSDPSNILKNTGSVAQKGDLVIVVRFDKEGRMLYFNKIEGKKEFYLFEMVDLKKVNALNPKDFYKGGF